jgi:hypothetical protein
MATFGSSWKEEYEDDINMFSHWKDDEDSGPEPNDALKSIKERYDEELKKQPYVSDDFQIGPDGAYEHNSDWDSTLMDGIEYESWDELYEDYVGESDLLEFINWLKENFQIPNKLR